MRSRRSVRLLAALTGLALSASGCTPGPAAPPIAEVFVPTAPPIASAQVAAPLPDEVERAPKKARVVGDLRSVVLRIVHTAHRQHDAEVIEKRLTNLGATVRLYPTSDDMNEPHVGHLYVKASAKKVAPLIVRAVEDIEAEEIVDEENLEGDHNAVLWIVR